MPSQHVRTAMSLSTPRHYGNRWSRRIPAQAPCMPEHAPMKLVSPCVCMSHMHARSNAMLRRGRMGQPQPSVASHQRPPLSASLQSRRRMPPPADPHSAPTVSSTAARAAVRIGGCGCASGGAVWKSPLTAGGAGMQAHTRSMRLRRTASRSTRASAGRSTRR